ncbi:hypothetical protein TorRG33x02_208680 [Trema orientale]|uniref:Uncharacterized protein n=1 Tax=Trema orientale TaxID=63057 RepID=A0A2P5ECM2_TREOI|nr:hypothetical protein TorRG33x02_208680 [Trema orientale]
MSSFLGTRDKLTLESDSSLETVSSDCTSCAGLERRSKKISSSMRVHLKNRELLWLWILKQRSLSTNDRLLISSYHNLQRYLQSIRAPGSRPNLNKISPTKSFGKCSPNLANSAASNSN